MGIDTPRRPETSPPQPRPPQSDAARHAEWHARNDASMTRRPEQQPAPRRQDQPPDRRQRGTGQPAAAPRQVPPADAGRKQPDARSDAGRRTDTNGHLSTDYRDWPKAPAVHEQPKLRVVHETRDVNQWRAQPGGPVNMDRMRADFTKDVGHQADLQKSGGHQGKLIIDVRLTNVGVGKGSEAVAIQRAMTDIGRKDGMLIRVSVERNGGLWTPGGQQLTLPAPRTPVVQVPPVVPHLPTQAPVYRPDNHHR